jgi:photosystem II stability/assembly factor-like uncharacterized protein
MYTAGPSTAPVARIYAALADRVLVVDAESDRSGRERLVGTDMECVAVDPAEPEVVFAGTVDDGLGRSTDGGDSWETVLEAGDRVTAVAVDPRDGDGVWAGTEPSAVYRSTDGGDSWRRRTGLTDLPSADRWSFPPRPHTHHVRWIEVDPADTERLYVAIEAGALVRSVDGGESWLDHPAGARRDTHELATHPDAPGRVYAAAGDGYADSDDGGDSWAHPQAGLDRRYVWSVAVPRADPDLVVVSAARGARAAHDPDGTAAVYRRRIGASGPDAGRWELAMDGLPGPDGTARPVLAAGRGERLYALSNHGLYRSERGADWDQLDVEWRREYLDHVPRGLAVGW